MIISTRKIEKIYITAISFVFVIWSAIFIYRSSIIAIDGKLYFNLFDDAMISMRYAWNFSHGLGLVWNQGEYIQGYTNLLMTLLMSVATLIFDKSTSALSIQVLGVGFMLAIAFICMKIADYIIPNVNPKSQALIRVLTFLGALSYYPLAYWSLMGMETGLLTFIMLTGVLFAFDYTVKPKPVKIFLVSGCLGLAFLTRNDSVIFAVIIWAYIVWEIFPSTIIANRNGLIKQLSIAISLYFLFIIGQLVFQYLYYGELLPNTYTLKLTGMPLFERIRDGAGFILPFLRETAIILILSITEIIIDFQKRKLLLFSIFLSAISYQIYVGGEPWAYWRIISPSIPLLFLLFISAINTFLHPISISQAFNFNLFHFPVTKNKFSNILLIAFTLFGFLFVNLRFLPLISMINKNEYDGYDQINVDTAIVLNQLTTNNATIGVYMSGTIPYYTDRKAIDFLGKSDSYIAQLPPDISGSVSWSGMRSVPGHNKYDLNYSIKTLEPTFVEYIPYGFKYGTQDLTQWAETMYVKVEYSGVSLFLLKDSPAVLWNKINVP